MKRFLIKLLIFVFLLWIIDYSCGFLLKAINDSTTKGDIGRNNYIMRDLSHKDILIFGSSRAIHHYNPLIFQDSLNMSCYNCGEDGMGIILNYSRLQAITTRYTPKIIIYDFEPSFDIEVNDNERYLGKLKPYYPEYSTDKVFDDVSKGEKIKMFSNLYSYNSQMIDLIIQKVSSSPETSDKYTYVPLRNTMDYEPEESSSNTDQNPDTLKIKYLRKFINLCHSKEVAVIFAVSPKYRNVSAAEIDIFKAICRENNVPIINHFTDSSYNLNRKMFNDQTHLNEMGANTYSKQVVSEVKQILSK